MELKEDQITFLHQYRELINTVEQAVHYINNKPQDEKPQAAKQMLPDVLAAYMQLNQAHSYLQDLLKDDEEVIAMIDTFNDIIGEAKGIDQTDAMLNQFALELLPRFMSWKERAEAAVVPYIEQ